MKEDAASPLSPPTPPPASDITIVGAGPAGLAFACALADAGLSCLVLEAQPLAALAAPADDGREIALSQRSIAELQRLGFWQDLAPSEISPLHSARVYNGERPQSLLFEDGARQQDLGALVPNAALRRVAWLGAQRRGARIRLLGQARVSGLARSAQQLRLQLDEGTHIASRLVVAADSRFSALRRMAGIGAEMLDFGRSVLLARVEHEQPHADQALECFHHGHTMAWLPLAGRSPRHSSLVLTLPADEAEAMRGWSEAHWLDWVQTRSQDRRGRLLRRQGALHHYPLVATYARHFALPRLALLGDAAVGMHPVTAHGFNFGLYGARRLADLLAAHPGADPGAMAPLMDYARGHWRETRAIYLGTHALVRLYTDERAPARLLRQGVLDLAQRLPPLRRLITGRLTDRPACAASAHQAAAAARGLAAATRSPTSPAEAMPRPSASAEPTKTAAGWPPSSSAPNTGAASAKPTSRPE
jgi:ubiquinone biosynthesis UbiH/UbiF/VisC/COQ6 family hydroxylase